MAKYVECPGCTSRIDATHTDCPVCMRPRTKKEIYAGLTGLPEKLKARKKFRLAFIALGGFLILTQSGYLDRFLNRPSKAGTPGTAGTPASEAARDAGRGAGGSPGSRSGETPALPAETAGPVDSPRSGSPQGGPGALPEAPNGWVVEGRVYDLVSLRPVANARLGFLNTRTGEKRRAATDPQGTYRIVLPPVGLGGGYAVSVARKGFSPDFLEDMEPPYSGQSEQRRAEAARMIRNTKILHVPLSLEEGQTSLRYDLVMLRRGT